MAMKKKAAAPKKAASKKNSPIEYQKGASERSKKAASKRLEAAGRKDSWDKFQKRMYNYHYSQGMRDKYVNWVGEGEGGGFWSSGLSRKEDQKRAKQRATEAKTASQQIKQGVTKSGGYAGPYIYNDLRPAREAAKRSDKFKAEQAVKKSGGSMTRNARNKKKNAK
jgi:hypothetical protein